MIDIALSEITRQLSQHIRRCYHVAEDLAIVSNLLDQDGSPVPVSQNKMVLFLVRIQPRETAYLNLGEETNDFKRIGSSPLVKWDLLLMCAANFSGLNYPNALKMLSLTIQFFHDHPLFNRENTLDLDLHIDKLTLSIEPMPISEISCLWKIHNNGHYLPSVLYRVQVFGCISGDSASTELPYPTTEQALRLG